jgi:hypothetical protein
VKIASETLPLLPRAQERFLDRVLRFIEGCQHPVAVDVELAAVSLGKLCERTLVAGDRGDDQVVRVIDRHPVSIRRHATSS